MNRETLRAGFVGSGFAANFHYNLCSLRFGGKEGRRGFRAASLTLSCRDGIPPVREGQGLMFTAIGSVLGKSRTLERLQASVKDITGDRGSLSANAPLL
jgi:hypothetical protein